MHTFMMQTILMSILSFAVLGIEFTLVKEKTECDSSEDFMGYFQTIQECANSCDGISSMFIYGTNDFGTTRCDDDGCKCYCETSANTNDHTCNQINHDGYRLYRLEVQAEDKGWNGCTDNSPCSIGQGDCDLDRDCASGLVCMQRTNGETLEGYDFSNLEKDMDVCVKVRSEDKGITACTENSPCGIGEGDCDLDRDCASGLICMKRTSGENLEGYDFSNIGDDIDVCGQVRSKYTGMNGCTENNPCIIGQGDCDLDRDCAPGLVCMHRTNAEKLEGYDFSDVEQGIDVCVKVPSEYKGINACTENSPCSIGQGDCDLDRDCGPGLICMPRTNGENLEGYDFSNLEKDMDVCVQVRSEYKGMNGCTENNPCSIGQGDCDLDRDCAPGLVCMKRANGENLEGYDFSDVEQNVDVCVKVPSEYKGINACTENSPCSIGQGDCDLDRDCGPGLICMPRKNGENLEGYDFSNLEKDIDVCVQVRSEYKGVNACTENSPCGIGQGDCNHDRDCGPGLICMQRSNGENLEGYDFSDMEKDIDVCVKVRSEYKGIAACTENSPCSIGQGDCDHDRDCGPGLVCLQRTNGENLEGYDFSDVEKDMDVCVNRKRKKGSPVSVALDSPVSVNPEDFTDDAPEESIYNLGVLTDDPDTADRRSRRRRTRRRSTRRFRI